MPNNNIAYFCTTISTSNFLAMDFSENPNPNPNYTYLTDNIDTSEFEVSNYLMLEDGSEEDSASQAALISPENDVSGCPIGFDNIGATSRNSSSNINCKSGVKRNKVDVGFRVAFRTKSELDVMNDGFKWRKYGKKTVKNSPNPRNYYKCSTGGCQVKKRVERDRDDSSYVITTYEGVHNHESPCVVYYNQMQPMVPSGWTLQASSP